MKAVEATEQLQISGVAEGPDNEFPDFYASVGGRRISIELTELLHSRGVLKSAAKRALRFESIQWTAAHFRTRVQDRVISKAAQLAASGSRCGVLILHTDEPWLTPTDVEQWLAEESFRPQEAIEAAYLLMTYEPGWAAHWPIFRLWGALNVASPSHHA